MTDLGLRLYLKSQQFIQFVLQKLDDEGGQDLVEYALIVGMLAFAATAAMTSVATKVGTAFQNIAAKFGRYTS